MTRRRVHRSMVQAMRFVKATSTSSVRLSPLFLPPCLPHLDLGRNPT